MATALLIPLLIWQAIEYCGTVCTDVLAAVSNSCRSVVACRARKDQKAQMLSLIKHNVAGSCCLAIGDGANDVAMIKAGHIGVGIIGKEGMQAVNNSDFAIGQFRFLRGLLLVHGRQNYRRFSIFVLYMLYINTAFVVTLFMYSMICLASSVRRHHTPPCRRRRDLCHCSLPHAAARTVSQARIYPFFYFDYYTVFYTSLPNIVYGFNDQVPQQPRKPQNAMRMIVFQARPRDAAPAGRGQVDLGARARAIHPGHPPHVLHARQARHVDGRGLLRRHPLRVPAWRVLRMVKAGLGREPLTIVAAGGTVVHTADS